MIKNYILIDKVYGNYISFQKKLIRIINKTKINSKQINILEIGFGTGITTEIIINACPNIKLTAIDIDSNMLKYASDNLKNYCNINFVRSDALKYLYKIPPNYFDIVVSAFTIHNLNLKYRNKLYSEIHRVLRKDSIFINADKFVSDNYEIQISSLKYRISTYIDTLLRENKYELLKEWVSHYIADQYPQKIMKLNEEKQTIIKNKFKKVRFIFKSESEMLAIIFAQK